MEENISILYAFTLLVGLVSGVIIATGYVEKDSANMLLTTEEDHVQEINKILASFNVTDQNRTVSMAIRDWHNQTYDRGTTEEIIGFAILIIGAIVAAYGFHKSSKVPWKEKQCSTR